MWSLTTTERVHAMRAPLAMRWADPRWVQAVDLTPGLIDAELLRLRGRYAYAMPGVEIR